MVAVGLMSGTSLDGIDAALVDVRPTGGRYALELLRFETYPLARDLRERLRGILPPNAGAIADAAWLHRELGIVFGGAARAVAGTKKIDFVASHGQTVWHDGPAHVTMQLGDAFAIRDLVNATVCYDFRSADCAAGGHGAPLVAWIDAVILGDAKENRIALNLGGIANLTLLRAGASPEEAIAFDTGPGNMLLDALLRERTGGKREFDRDGTTAGAGVVDHDLLDAMLSDAYFAAPPPKTTGRERFGPSFLARYERLAQLSLEDAAATLAELTAASIAQEIERFGLGAARVIVSGGGARNKTMIRRLAARVAPFAIEPSDAVGIPVDAKEAIAFAVLGYETLRGRTANVPNATGAARRVVLGAIAPHDLTDLLAAVQYECNPR
ncbi:MAG: anhydro-N-acetylmuramic acid kinase [Candidatus Eremiobacteraeota bacterium]|nr:anhydro-N-acetylmuramic acid kinase [Candidatus Eremiobacteraeota bacterium]